MLITFKEYNVYVADNIHYFLLYFYFSQRNNTHRSDSYKFSSFINYCKSTIELQHFHLHNFKNVKIEIFKLKKRTSFPSIIVYEFL